MSLPKDSIMSRKLPFTIEEFKSIYSRVPRSTVELVLENKEGILLTLREKHGWVGQWHLPGSTVYLGESLHNAVLRVAKEELGIAIKIEKFIGTIEYLKEAEERGYGHTISQVYKCSPMSDNIVLDEDTSKFKFFNELPEKTILEQKAFLSKHILQIISDKIIPDEKNSLD